MARYDAFLLRIWHTEDATGEHVSIRLQHLPHGEIARLATLEELLTHLQAVVQLRGELPQATSGMDSGTDERCDR